MIPVPDREYRLSLPVGEIAVCEWGDESAPPLLLLHGWLDNAATFFTTAPFLATQFRCIAIDFPGHGLSSHLGNFAQYHFVDGVLAVHSVLEALDISRCAMVGHSMGGALGLLYAACFPEHVSHLVSIDAFGPLVCKAEESVEQMREACIERSKRKDSKKALYRSVDLALAIRATAGDCPQELLRPIVERNLHETDGGFQWSSDARLRWPSLLRMSPEHVTSFMQKLTMPVLVIQAQSGLSFVPKALQAFSASVPNLTVHTVPGGHHVHLEQPQTVADLSRAFLQH